MQITAFKPFFVSLNLPYSTKRGEEFALQVTVFNYLSTPLQVKFFWLTANKCGCNYVALFIMCIFLCFHRVILVILQAVVALKESDYFKVRVPNAIQPQKETVLKMVEVSLAF